VTRQRIIPMRRSDNALDWVTFVLGEAGAPYSVCVHVATMRNTALGSGTRTLAVKVPEILSHSIHLWIGESDWHPEVILVLVEYDVIN